MGRAVTPADPAIKPGAPPTAVITNPMMAEFQMPSSGLMPTTVAYDTDVGIVATLTASPAKSSLPNSVLSPRGDLQVGLFFSDESTSADIGDNGARGSDCAGKLVAKTELEPRGSDIVLESWSDNRDADELFDIVTGTYVLYELLLLSGRELGPCGIAAHTSTTENLLR